MDLFEFEVAEDAPGGAAPAEPEPAEPAGEPEPDDEGGDEPQGGFDESAFRQWVSDELDARLAAQQPQQPYAPVVDQFGQPDPYAQPFDPSQLDPYSEDFGQQLVGAIGQIVQQAVTGSISPITQALGSAQAQQQQQEWEATRADLVADEISRGGDVTEAGRVLMESLVDSFMGEAVQRYGPSVRAAETAAGQAAEFVRELEAQAEARALEKHKNHLQTLGAAPTGEPGQAAAAVVPGTPMRAQSADEIVRKYAAG